MHLPFLCCENVLHIAKAAKPENQTFMSDMENQVSAHFVVLLLPNEAKRKPVVGIGYKFRWHEWLKVASQTVGLTKYKAKHFADFVIDLKIQQLCFPDQIILHAQQESVTSLQVQLQQHKSELHENLWN